MRLKGASPAQYAVAQTGVADTREHPDMAICGACGNDHDKTFEALSQVQTHTFDSFQGAIHRLAPACTHCGVRISGTGLEQGGRIFCGSHCAGRGNVNELRERA